MSIASLRVRTRPPAACSAVLSLAGAGAARASAAKIAFSMCIRASRLRPILIDRDDSIHRAPLGGADQMLVGDPDGVEHGLDVGAPMVEEAVEHREAGGDVILLPDEELEEV